MRTLSKSVQSGSCHAGGTPKRPPNNAAAASGNPGRRCKKSGCSSIWLVAAYRCAATAPRPNRAGCRLLMSLLILCFLALSRTLNRPAVFRDSNQLSSFLCLLCFASSLQPEARAADNVSSTGARAAHFLSTTVSGIFRSLGFSHVKPVSDVRPKWPIAEVSK